VNPLILPLASPALPSKLDALPALIEQGRERLQEAADALQAHDLTRAEAAFQRAGDIARFASYVVQAARPK
jgi:flagellin-specific chaperone FliS